MVSKDDLNNIYGTSAEYLYDGDAVTFYIAKNNTHLRQEYLDNLNWKNKLYFVGKVRYDKNCSKRKLITASPPNGFLKHFRRPVISVNPRWFLDDIFFNEEDFLHNLYNSNGYAAFEIHLMTAKRKLVLMESADPKGKGSKELQRLVNMHRIKKFALDALTDKNSPQYVQRMNRCVIDLEDKILGTAIFSNTGKYVDTEKMLAKNSPLDFYTPYH